MKLKSFKLFIKSLLSRSQRQVDRYKAQVSYTLLATPENRAAK